jgi:di/tricarboxylate transporter
MRLDGVIDGSDEIDVIEAVVTGESLLVGWSPSQLRLSDRFAVEIVGVQRHGATAATQLKSFRFAPGDVVVLRTGRLRLAEALSTLNLLPLATRDIALGQTRNWVLPVAILAIAMLLMTLKLVSVPVAFFGAAVFVVAVGAISLRDSYDALDPPVLVTLACLIPLSDSLRSTGITDLASAWLSANAVSLHPMVALTLIMVTAMVVTPFLNNAATVLVAAPIAASFAEKLGYNPDPFLMAVALGAASDFLTPIGHQCNMLVYGPGGYRFADYQRLGLPLSILVVAAGVPLIAWFWPTR